MGQEGMFGWWDFWILILEVVIQPQMFVNIDRTVH